MAETAVASRDLETQYWIRDLVDEADRDRRLAEDKLYVGSSDALKQAEGLWETLASDDGKGGKYREALRRAKPSRRPSPFAIGLGPKGPTWRGFSCRVSRWTSRTCKNFTACREYRETGGDARISGRGGELADRVARDGRVVEKT